MQKNRRKLVVIKIIAIMFIFMSCSEQKYDSPYREIPENQVLAEPPDIIEFFYYPCSHCNDMEPKLKEWLKQKRDRGELVEIELIPYCDETPVVLLNARAFYIGKELNISNKSHSAMFDSYHKHGQRIKNEKDLQLFFLGLGVAKEDYLNAAGSEQVKLKIQRARLLSKNLELPGVPSFIVKGKYITSAEMTYPESPFVEIERLLTLPVEKM